jgi:5'-nucleotidase
MTERVNQDNIVLVDMDGVLADFDGAVIDRLPLEIARVARTNFYISQDYPDHTTHVHAITSHPEFFRSLPVIDGALEGWQRLIDLGYDPRICSAPLTANEQSVAGKLAWLQDHFVPKFGKQVVERAIIDKQKYKYDGLVLIDDRPEVETNNGQATWQHVVYDRFYNQQSNAKLRLFGWNDQNLESLLDRARINRA